MSKTIGDFSITERGIEKIVDADDDGTLASKLIISKEAFIEAYNKWIAKGNEDNE